MLNDRMKKGVLERYYGLYRNPWFLVKKKDMKYRLINAAMWLNKVTIRDVILSLTVDEFAERFASMLMVTLVDLHLGYD